MGIFTFILLSTSLGQAVQFTAQAPKVVRPGEQIQLVYSVNEKVDGFTPPDFGEFQYLGGPSQSSSTSFSMVNGRTTRTSTYTFTYYIQAPQKTGKYSLPPATATFKRKTIQSNTLDIEVVGAAPQTGKPSGKQQQAEPEAVTAGEDLFVRIELDKRSAYVGEQITAWVRLYVDPQVTISGYDQQFKGPEFTGFFRQNVELPPLTSLERAKVGNDIYGMGVLQKVILYPQKPGEVTIEPFDLLVEVQQHTRRQPQSIFDEFFGPQYQRKRVSLKSKPVKLSIKSLPGNQPAGFSGAVGDFQMSASANNTQVQTNDAITFKVRVAGRGNIRLIDEVVNHFPPTFDVFDPIKKVQLDENTDGRTGSVSFEYTAIPRHAGNFSILPFELIYFDPQSGTYKTLKSQSFSIGVEKGEGDTTTVVTGALSKEAIELLGSDIRYIETETELKPKDRFIFGSMWYYEVFITVFLLFIGILIIRREQMRQSVDVARYRNRKAGKVVSKRLRKAHKLLKSNQIKEYYVELERALWGYLSDKLTLPVSELSTERVRAVLGARNISEELVNEFITLIDSCQFARYAPGGMGSEMSGSFERARSIIHKLDQKL